MVKVKKIGALSAAKIAGVLYAVFGLIGALIIAPLMVVPAVLSAESSGTWLAIVAVFVIVLLPVAYGIMGFAGGAVSAFLYNLVAARTGGIELEIETDDSYSIKQAPG